MMLWDHTGDELLAIPLPDLALLVLADFKQGNGWNQRSWMLEAQQGHTEVARRAGVLDRLAEAWAWLNAKAFVSWRPDQDTPDSRRVTDEGHRALELGLVRLHAAQRLDVELLPDLEKARRQFLQGDYEEAVFASFRAVEEEVRGRAAMTAGDLGVKLMRQAFKPEVGPLTDSEAEAGEQEAVSNLFAGAIGTFKNPSSHRTVDYDDPTLAAEAVLLADLLLRLLGRLSGAHREET
jgi:uncharacterized protein (TIGR02391 family)